MLERIICIDVESDKKIPLMRREHEGLEDGEQKMVISNLGLISGKRYVLITKAHKHMTNNFSLDHRSPTVQYG